MNEEMLVEKVMECKGRRYSEITIPATCGNRDDVDFLLQKVDSKLHVIDMKYKKSFSTIFGDSITFMIGR